MLFRSRVGVALLFVAGVAALESRLPAQEAKADATKQKATVAANLKKADLTKTAIVETDHFLVATTLTEEKTRALAAVIEKVVPVARKSLQFDSKEEMWKGKLTVYHLPDSRDFKAFMRSVVVTQPAGTHYDVRADDPFVVDPVDVPGKATEADQFANTAATVAGAILKAKGASANLPDWLVGGFGRATAMRAEGVNSKRYQTYKTAARTLANRGAKPIELWGETKPANAETLATSFAEYLAYGPGAPDFVKLVIGYRPDENGNATSPEQAFEAAGWKDLAMLEAAWRKWAVSGK